MSEGELEQARARIARLERRVLRLLRHLRRSKGIADASREAVLAQFEALIRIEGQRFEKYRTERTLDPYMHSVRSEIIELEDWLQRPPWDNPGEHVR